MLIRPQTSEVLLDEGYIGEQRNLFPRTLDYFVKNQEEIEDCLSLINKDLDYYRYYKNQRLDFQNLKERVILSILHEPPEVISDKLIETKVFDFLDLIAKRIKDAEETPIDQNSAQKKYKRIQKEQSKEAQKVIEAAFRLNNLDEVTNELSLSLDKVFIAMRYFERKMLRDQKAPIAREFFIKNKNTWKALGDSSKEALNCEFAGFSRDQTAGQLGITNRTLTNKFGEIRRMTGVDKESFNQIKERQARLNVNGQDLLDDRLLNLLFDKNKLKESNKNAFYNALKSLSKDELVLKITQAMDLIPDRFQEAILNYINDDEIHTNSLTGHSGTRTLRTAAQNVLGVLKPMLLEKVPAGVDAAKWANFRSSKVRQALGLYLQGYKRQEIEVKLSSKITVENFWLWKKQFKQKFGFTKESFAKLRLRNKIARLKKDKFGYRKRAFNIVFPKLDKKPERQAGESEDKYYERIFSLINTVASQYRRKESYGYFKHRIIGLSANEIASIYGLTKGSALKSIQNFAKTMRSKVLELANLDVPQKIDPLKWLSIERSQRPIMKLYLNLKASKEPNLYDRLSEVYPGYSTTQLQSLTHQARKKLGLRIINR